MSQKVNPSGEENPKNDDEKFFFHLKETTERYKEVFKQMKEGSMKFKKRPKNES